MAGRKPMPPPAPKLDGGEAGGVKIFMPDWMRSAFEKAGPWAILACGLIFFFMRTYSTDIRAIQDGVERHIATTDKAIARRDVSDAEQTALLRELVRLGAVRCYFDAKGNEEKQRLCGDLLKMGVK